MPISYWERRSVHLVIQSSTAACPIRQVRQKIKEIFSRFFTQYTYFLKPHNLHSRFLSVLNSLILNVGLIANDYNLFCFPCDSPSLLRSFCRPRATISSHANTCLTVSDWDKKQSGQFGGHVVPYATEQFQSVYVARYKTNNHNNC